MAKVSQEQKLAALKDWLRENDVEFVENHESKYGVMMDVKIPKLMIAVFVSDGDREWEESRYAATTDGYHLLFKKYKPFFIRPTDTKAFTLEKIANCCYDRFIFMQKRWQRTEEQKGRKEAKK